MVGQFLGNHPIELGRDHLLVELLDLEADFIGRMGQIDFACPRVQKVELLVLLEHDAGARQRGLDPHRRLVIDQVAVNDGLPVGVGEDRIAEDVRRVQRRRGGEADLHGVEIFQHAAIFRDVVLLPAEAQLGVGHFAIEQIAAMAFIDHHQVVLVDGRRFRAIGRIQHALHQALDGADVDLGFGSRASRPASFLRPKMSAKALPDTILVVENSPAA